MVYAMRFTPCAVRSTGMARITIHAGSSFRMAIEAPVHVVSVNHREGPCRGSCHTMTDRTVDVTLNMDPVGENNVFWKFVHPFPGDLPGVLHVFDHFERLGLLTHGIGRMAGPAQIDVRDGRRPIFLDIAVAERAVQFGRFYMAQMIENDGLINGGPRKDREDTKENTLGDDLKSMVSDDAREKENKNGHKPDQFSFHIISLAGQTKTCQAVVWRPSFPSHGNQSGCSGRS